MNLPERLRVGHHYIVTETTSPEKSEGVAEISWTEVAIEMVRRYNNYASIEQENQRLREALIGLLPYLPTEGELLDNAALNDGRANPYDIAARRARQAIKR